ncbi:shikimate dehydrogenase [Bacillus mangrovi]|uniref:Shikimate dehydrogenase (NADP(+)) n=1 Tax=Metabacillus mangrovi TaxID=1491830 RepID=A0A7X2S2I7_9BACI|nr:shikimate dehydrogenase [Metabacillus mangrovi]MTH52502.1 shikimate dehydrogenase [Metabacillus mangrovi]
MEELYGIIGCPVGHSMSPDIHNQAFKALGIKASYHRFHVEKSSIKAAVEGIRALGIKGANVTIPHKEAVLEFLDETDPSARAMGAVNTIVNRDGRLIGYNTDGPGYIESIKPFTGSNLKDLKCLIIGAGGAARGIYSALALEGIKEADIANRTIEKAALIIKESPAGTKGTALTLTEAEARLSGYDLIIQTTSIGMSPNVNGQPLSLEKVRSGTLVSDIIYNPMKTAFLKDAEHRGCRIIPGIGMFVYQAALSFRHWTGVLPDIRMMEETVKKKLGGT